MYESIFQTPEWEEFKLKTGYQKSYHVEDILVLQKDLPLGFSMLYSPMVSELQYKAIKSKEFVAEIKKIAKECNALFYRLELDIAVNESKTLDSILHTPDFRKSFEEMQPENNWLLDLAQTEEELLANMKQKGRYNIRQGDKAEIKVTYSEKAGREMEAFYAQYSETGKRHNISHRTKKYFDALLEIFGANGQARVYTAWKDDVALASAVMLYYNKEALYLFGGSSDQMRNLMAPYFLQWQLIKDAKSLGCEKYNFLGVAPNDDPHHPWAGLTLFKKRFGGYQRDIVGCYDLPTKPFLYKLFKIAEKLRR